MLYNKYEFPQPNKGATIIIKLNIDFILFHVSQRIFKGDLKMKIFYTPLVTKYPTIFLSALNIEWIKDSLTNISILKWKRHTIIKGLDNTCYIN